MTGPSALEAGLLIALGWVLVVSAIDALVWWLA